MPEHAAPHHIVVKMAGSAINPGDKAFLKLPVAPGAAVSRHDIWGASGAGIVVEIGEGVSKSYIGKPVAIYRSMVPSENLVGTWSEYLQVPVLGAVILPYTVKPIDYSGSLVNIVTPFAFLKDVMAKNHKALICTAGSSATGIAMLGLCQANHIPLISIVRNEASRVLVEKLGGSHIVIESHPDFKAQLTHMAQELGVTVVFDGVGGATLSEIIETLPQNTMIYSYGYLGGATPLTIHTRHFNFRGIKIEGFSNTKSAIVKDNQLLESALKEIGEIIHQPHFKTTFGKTFALESINDALAYSGDKGERAILVPC